ncbi:MAG: N-linked glycosylation glycosyltransferase PglG [uncultured Sulfurovum sp.]|uniref:N-linked glycosylation glycosyltransferase PglG n=1 Tax=uncultured Sulfurovum sp. TaxID=269237 RepID=A0A6S6UAV9_9BACT|nr:MAG: N-linked glycosylation glycosyltransferase PglG [uncultured Sulfurovum sp.]
MKVVINTYKKHKITVDNFIITSIKNASINYIDNAESILKKNNFIQLIYSVDEAFNQVSPVICKKQKETLNIGNNKSHYFAKLHLDEDGFYISNPYIHYRTGKASVTVVRKIDDYYYVFDCNLFLLLEELKLIEYNSLYDKTTRMVYAIGATILAIVAMALIVHGGYKLFEIFLMDVHQDFFHSIFKSIIAVTLGIAIFDLAKQIMEHEVLFHNFSHEEGHQYMVLGKFLSSIVIALSIETLMVVFKITLDDYKNMLYAFYLIIGTTAMFVGLAFFFKTIQNSKQDKNNES